VARGLVQVMVAAQIGEKQERLSAWELGRYPLPASVATRLAEYYGMPPARLVHGMRRWALAHGRAVPEPLPRGALVHSRRVTEQPRP
jgi:hypothetical protein